MVRSKIKTLGIVAVLMVVLQYERKEMLLTSAANMLFILMIYMAMQNDVSFMIGLRLSLYEHQSTFNPNLPLRYLFYISDLYSGMIDKNKLYGSRKILIPPPEFVIFYNGIQDQPDRRILRLSDLYSIRDQHCKLELEAVMLNINLGHNPALMNACTMLHQYAEYTDRVRRLSAFCPRH